MRDGPFARLAKENDIVWTAGGRPDDTTVVAARVSLKESVRPWEGGNLDDISSTLVVGGGATAAVAATGNHRREFTAPPNCTMLQ